MGDWIGRESQGGQTWLTYHLSPREMVQASFRHAKAADDFIPRFGISVGANSWILANICARGHDAEQL